VALFLAACGSPAKTASSPSTSAVPTATSTSVVPVTTVPPPAPSWTTYGGGFSRTSANTAASAVTAAPTPVWTSPALDGPVYGEPLVFGGDVLVATENDTVYGLSLTSGKVAWSDHLATPASAGDLPCGDISPTVGITSTMVVDPTTDMLFASAETEHDGSVAHLVDAIDLADHQVVWSRDVDQPAWTADTELQRVGLGLDHGRVLVGFGGNEGDCGSYHGWLLGVPESGSGAILAYQVPTAREGAIWAPAGVTVDSAGDVYVATGNGSALPGQPFDHGDAVIELSSSLHELGYFAPTTWAQDNADDGDLGSTSPILLPGNQLFEVGKEVTAYLLDASDLGGIGGQLSTISVCNSRGGNAYAAPDAYVVCPDEGQIDQIRIGPGNTMTRGWQWSSPTGGASSPTVSGGVVWTIDLGASKLYGIDAATGATRYALSLDVGTPPHFAAPSVSTNVMVVAGSSAVEAFR
jgi:hypothetical protein